MERSYLSLSSGGISYLERKGQYPIIFLHGLGGTGNNWLKLAGYLPDIPETLGTAVSVVSMVFGNMGDDSATGVACRFWPVLNSRI